MSFSQGEGENKEIRAIEVKGTLAKNNIGIPDLFETEVSERGKLIATHRYLVVFGDGLYKDPSKLFIIPAKEFKSEDFYESKHYRIKSNFYTRNSDKTRLDKFEVKVYD